MRPAALSSCSLAVVSLSLVACGGGAGAPAQSVRPTAQTASQAMGEKPDAEAACRDVNREGKPLIVDWKPEQRGDLEVAMSGGVAVVAYDCKRLELLSDCKAEGSYGFKGVVLKQQLIRLSDADEVKVNLPLSGPLLAAKLGGELGRGTTLDLATALVGNRVSTRAQVARSELSGRCDGATHFVRGANIGAFVMQTGEEARLASAAEVFGAGASARSQSSKLARQEDGSLDACKAITSEMDRPPANCGALVRLHLVAITAAPEKPAAPAPNATFVKVHEEEEGCPAGMLFAGGKCVAPTATVDKHVCKQGDVPDCTKQCDAGEAWSCSRLGTAYVTATGVAEDATRGATLYKKSCELGHPGGCSNFGLMLSKGSGVTRDDALAAKQFERACSGGDAVGCFNLGAMHFEGRGVGKDEAKAAGFFKQSCDGGSAAGCVNLGAAFDDGLGVPKDQAKARTLFRRACEGDKAEGCTNLGVVSADDPKAAVKAYTRGCELGSAKACDYLGKRYAKGDGVDKDGAKAKELQKRSCDLGHKPACDAK